MGTRIIFTAGNHTYSLDGKRVPGVTTVLGKTNGGLADALAGAAAKETALWAVIHADEIDTMGRDTWVRNAKGAYRDTWNASKDRGTRVHEAARQLVAGELLTPADPDTGEAWPDDERDMAEHLARFFDAWDVQPLAAERPVFHETDRWAGTIDLVARMGDGRRWLLDFKTAKDVYAKDAMQLATYRHATHIQVETVRGLEDWPMPQVDECAVVHVRPDGWQLRPVRADRAMYDVFRSMLPVADWASWKTERSVLDPVPVPSGGAS
jgi:hypothetical protein